MRPALNRILLYAKDMQATCTFYERHFAFECTFDADRRIAELVSPYGGVIIMVHQAAKGVRSGQASVKLVFDIEDIEGADSCRCPRYAISPTPPPSSPAINSTNARIRFDI